MFAAEYVEFEDRPVDLDGVRALIKYKKPLMADTDYLSDYAEEDEPQSCCSMCAFCCWCMLKSTPW